MANRKIPRVINTSFLRNYSPDGATLFVTNLSIEEAEDQGYEDTLTDTQATGIISLRVTNQFSYKC